MNKRLDIDQAVIYVLRTENREMTVEEIGKYVSVGRKALYNNIRILMAAGKVISKNRTHNGARLLALHDYTFPKVSAPATKCCNKCREEKPNTAEYFPVVKTITGLGPRCKACKNKDKRKSRVRPAMEDESKTLNRWDVTETKSGRIFNCGGGWRPQRAERRYSTPGLFGYQSSIASPFIT